MAASWRHSSTGACRTSQAPGMLGAGPFLWSPCLRPPWPGCGCHLLYPQIPQDHPQERSNKGMGWVRCASSFVFRIRFNVFRIRFNVFRIRFDDENEKKFIFNLWHHCCSMWYLKLYTNNRVSNSQKYTTFSWHFLCRAFMRVLVFNFNILLNTGVTKGLASTVPT